MLSLKEHRGYPAQPQQLEDMMNRLFVAAALTAGLFAGETATLSAQDSGADTVPEALNFTVKSIDGEDVKLADYQGQVLVVVNVASRCGLTPQYAGLEALYSKNSDKGLAVLGFPCNQFAGQEPGSDEEIKTFCTDNYDVSFDMFSKVEVNGENASDFFAHLTQLDTEPAEAGDISWNFEKFVIGRDGKVVGRFGPRTKPDDEAFVAVIQKALEQKQ